MTAGEKQGRLARDQVGRIAECYASRVSSTARRGPVWRARPSDVRRAPRSTSSFGTAVSLDASVLERSISIYEYVGRHWSLSHMFFVQEAELYI